MSITHFTWLALIICVAGCTKKEELSECLGSCTVISGRLLTSGSAPIANVPVAFIWTGRPSGGSVYKSNKKAEVRTDADGRYRVSGFLTDDELANGYIKAVFAADPSQYYVIGELDQAFINPKRDTIYTASDYLIPRKAYLKLVVSNPSQIPNHGAFLSDFNNCYGGNTVYSTKIGGGGPVVFWDTLPLQNPMEVSGDQPILIRHHRYISGLLTHTTDSIFIPAGTTRTYTATY